MQPTNYEERDFMDNVIFVISMHLIILFFIDEYNLHNFAGESLLSIISGLVLIYFYHRWRNKK